MSNGLHGRLNLCDNEEAVDISFPEFVKISPPTGGSSNPVSEYFSATESLKVKIIEAAGVGDAELFGLLTIGVISSVEYYLRSVLSAIPFLCPVARRHVEMAMVPIGAFDFYGEPSLRRLSACFDHESLADGDKIKKYCEKFTGLKLSGDSSANKTIDDFDTLCEIRHCLVHTRGFVGLKASNSLGLQSRSPSKVVISLSQALEVVKLSHNVVRAINRFLSDGIASRWVDQSYITGDWAEDKKIFEPLVRFFVYSNGTAATNVYRLYQPFLRASALRERRAEKRA
ncbi:hypothetical protein [Stenotrophomonas forensis]|uniref:hypothetical protein n=1 Tax=Stenotrophomonas forensis TaxID=2871169 RepID=UPI0039C5FAA7